MAYLFDIDALSEVMRREPNAVYVAWLRTIPREEQFASAVSIGELFQGAYRSPKRASLLERIEAWVLPAVTRLGSTSLGLTQRSRRPPRCTGGAAHEP